MIIAVDFDGTCVTHEFPKVGKDIGAVPVLRKLVENGHQLILYTMRSSKPGISPVTKQWEDGGLKDAVKWFEANSIPLYSIQTNPTQNNWTESPKCYAELYIDDAALGCPLKYESHAAYEAGERPFVDWERVEDYLKDRGII
jgi:hypothetical protein